MLNSQLLNNLSDFFAAFKELVELAKTDKLETVVAGLGDAKAALAQQAAAKKDLAALEEFKTTKQSQLDDLDSKRKVVNEAASLNKKQAAALQDAKVAFAGEKKDFADVQKQHSVKENALVSRETAVADAELAVKDTQAAAAQSLLDAGKLKQSYIDKLKTLAQTEVA